VLRFDLIDHGPSLALAIARRVVSSAVASS
jgi:hypothetical protein